jgi:hypothetical protein
MKRTIGTTFLLGLLVALLQGTAPPKASACYVSGPWLEPFDCDCSCEEGTDYKRCNREWDGDSIRCPEGNATCTREGECKDNMCLPTCGGSGSGS